MTREVPTTVACPKCGGTARGPKYRKDPGIAPYEYLAYVCGTCGFEVRRPTLEEAGRTQTDS